MNNMRYLSQIFQPVITIPKNAKLKNTEITCKSQKLLLECGLIRPTSTGLFSLLPLARRALNKLEHLILSSLDTCGGQQVSLPALTAAGLWKKTGREQGTELCTVTDRHGKKYVLSPTHEEAVADLLADVGPLSYKQLPLLLYQITNKYRDEQRPKHGLLRAREFLMMDAYGVHTDNQCATHTYSQLTDVYTRIFNKLELPVHRVEAPTGEMGGSLSHEWQLPANSGEDQIDICLSCSHTGRASEADVCGKCGGKVKRENSIEVGHTFILGTRYSEPLSAHYVTPSGASQPVIMSCYGIGLTRLLAASLEHLSSEKSLRWPSHIAPYDIIIIGPKEGSKEWSALGDSLQHVHSAVTSQRRGDTTSPRDVIIDDRHHLTIGKRMLMADRMGYPNIIVMGKSILDEIPKYEVYTAGESNPRLMTLDELQHTELKELEVNKIKN